MSLLTETNGKILSWEVELLKKHSGYFRSLFSFEKDIFSKQPYLIENFDFTALENVHLILHRPGQFPVLETEEEFEELIALFDYLLIDHDPQELRLLTGRMDWLSGYSEEFEISENRYGGLVINHLEKPRFEISLEIYAFLKINDEDEEEFTKQLKNYGINLLEEASEWRRIMFYGMLSRYIDSDLIRKDRETFYRRFEPYEDLKGQTVFSSQNKVFCHAYKGGGRVINFDGYSHPFYRRISMSIDITPGILIEFHSFEKEVQWIEKYPSMEQEENKYGKATVYHDRDIIEVLKILEEENVFAFTPSKRGEFGKIHSELMGKELQSTDLTEARSKIDRFFIRWSGERNDKKNLVLYMLMSGELYSVSFTSNEGSSPDSDSDSESGNN